jgi:c-di-GMP-binding flagellar brake protein YcgR
MLSNIISLGDKIDLTKSDYNFTGNEPIYGSQVLEIENEIIKISAPIENGKIIPLSVDKHYYLCFYTDKGLYRCKAKIIDRYKTEKHHVLCVELSSSLDKYQRRQFYRLDCVMDFMFQNEYGEDQWMEGAIIDLSGGGLKFISSKKLEPNDNVTCKIQLNHDLMPEYIEVFGKVLTSETALGYEAKYEHRVEFDIDQSEREIIIKYIFDEERRRRKQKKD